MKVTFSVKNWDEFQHYKDRNPPWIKLHNHLLDDYEFEMLGGVIGPRFSHRNRDSDQLFFALDVSNSRIIRSEISRTRLQIRNMAANHVG